MIDSTSGYATATKRAVTKPKLYDEQLAFLVERGTKERVEAVRGSVSKAKFFRSAIDAAIAKAERELKRRDG